jgi:large repetitive protein
MKQRATRRFATLVGTLLVVVLALSGAALAATTPLVVTKTVPAGGAAEVAPAANVKAYFNHDMKASTITSSTFKIRKQGTTTWLGATRSVNNTISPTSTNASSQSVATLNPNSDLAANSTYQVMVVGGSSGVKDLNGNALGANKSWTFKTVDTIAPAAPAITSPQENGFVGTSFTLSGTAEPNATVEVFEGTTSQGKTQANGSGIWSKALSGLSEGAHAYTAKATDAVGNTSSASNARTVKVDTQAPSAPAITNPADNSYDNDGSFTLSGTAEANSTVTIFEGTTPKGTTQTGAGGNWSKALSGVADGSHTYTAKATDAAGNSSALSNARTLTVDTTPPTVNNISPANGATANVTTNVTATFSEAMDTSTVSDQSFTLSKAGSPVSAQVTYDQNSRMATLDPAGDLQAGATYDAKITTSVKDSAGNALIQEKTWSFTVEAPPATVSPDPLDFGSACLTTVTKSVTITNNTASQVDLSPSVTSLAFSVASDELHIAAGQSTDLPISWTAGGAHKQLNTGSLELKNASGNVVATSGLKAFVFCPIDG